MDKQHILNEIRRTAEQNGGKPLGRKRFAKETGITEVDWAGVYWVRWNEVVQEAGYKPNSMRAAYDNDLLFGKLADFISELGHYPVRNELRIRARNDLDFPNESTFQRLGKRSDIARKVIGYCLDRGGLHDVIEICQPIAAKAKEEKESVTTADTDGYVYLMKSGKYYKIGFTNSLDRRQYEIGMQLPQGIEPIHSIRTDDPSGIEAYWHHRFRGMRMNGEWFNLTLKDVAIFKKRKFM